MRKECALPIHVPYIPQITDDNQNDAAKGRRVVAIPPSVTAAAYISTLLVHLRFAMIPDKSRFVPEQIPVIVNRIAACLGPFPKCTDLAGRCW